MYTDNGNDVIDQTKESYDIFARDFDEKNDKVYLYGGIGKFSGTAVSVKYDEEKDEYYISVNGSSVVNRNKRLYIDNMSYDKINKWITVAKEGRYKSPEYKKKDVIQIYFK